MPTPEHIPVEFHILSFEGPDPYARAGGIASRSICRWPLAGLVIGDR
jgi:hypothetical protein